MAYYGYIEIEVREMRGTGMEGAMVDQGNKAVVRVEDDVAENWDPLTPGSAAVLAQLHEAIQKVANVRVMVELDEEWKQALRSASPARLRKALRALQTPLKHEEATVPHEG